MIKGFLNLPWFVWAGITLIVAVIYSFVWPQKAGAPATSFRFFVLRWGHTLTWILLAINFGLRGVSPSLNSTANIIALIGGAMYALFIVMAFIVK